MIGFTTPWLLWALAALPVIWILLRIVPPAPILRRFPGIVLLFGLKDEDSAAARTPPLLLLIRLALIAAAILAFAGPVLNPAAKTEGRGPLLILTDASWADAADWSARRARLGAALAEAKRAGRAVAFLNLSDPAPLDLTFSDGAALEARLAALDPSAWEPPSARMTEVAANLPAEAFDTLWLSDGLDRKGKADLASALAARGTLQVIESPRGAQALGEMRLLDGKVTAKLFHPLPGGAPQAVVIARGLDPAGIERELARTTVALTPGEAIEDVAFELPSELRNRVTRLEIEGEASAGAVLLADDALKRRKVALVASGTPQEGLELLSPLHYLRKALAPNVDLVEGTFAEVLPAAPEVIVMADVARLPGEDADRLAEWVEEGGLLVRFAGPRLAAAVGLDGMRDPLLPVNLRPGGRSVGGTMSWGAPRTVAPFAEGSPFAGLQVPDEVKVTAQVLAEPSPDLADKVLASLDDGTPLVTRAALGDGQVVLFHVTANAEWSGLPLSGLFVSMLDRLAISSQPNRPAEKDMTGTVWQAARVMDAYGALAPAEDIGGVPGARLAESTPAPDMPPGLYQSDERSFALNVLATGRTLGAARWPAGTLIAGLDRAEERPLKGWVLSLALLLMLADVLATLILTGRLKGRLGAPRRVPVALFVAVVSGAALLGAGGPVRAEGADEARLLEAAGGMTLGHVLTGDARVDEMAHAGLVGLSSILTQRTSVEPGAPLAVDLERDDLAVFTFLYWPISLNQPAPSVEAYRKLNRFLQTGGMILFDTRDADVSGGGGQTPEGRRLQELAALLDVPPLEVLPKDHVLTRSFYLLQDLPGRHTSRAVWVEAAPPDAEQAEGVPFRNLNDGVSPVVIGGNDWAAAWAIDEYGNPAYPVGRGLAGDRQREIAYRFGINLVMYVLTGNYKSDQVHVPALLERLGQ
ncbi:DUF4159 domain-containing protein [Frigidibacter sp. RF13]|uniref:DUF4159 domain-containing protein n=1 Tax=Frigidibacter sp. RF13 TaxID=2997340 RepID=UPI00226DE153|nr:DUF4159 domain-containing protein [Frigidibacter sp. RF13]MCY1126854.1 DUF4159 domain-containing protein [Frigidibacter sp. RF13]